MKKKRVLFPILFLLLIISCDRSEPVPVTPTPKPPTVTDVVTPQNVKNYMVDKNASTETAALFYNN